METEFNLLGKSYSPVGFGMKFRLTGRKAITQMDASELSVE